jgi:ATP-binding cassette subfamily B protein RaxB
MTAAAMIKAAEAIGLDATVIEADSTQLSTLAIAPLILHWRGNHYVVLEKIDRGTAIVNDPGRGRLKLPVAALEQAYSGVCIAALPGVEFGKARISKRPWRLFLPELFALWPSFVALLLLTVALELLALVMPLQLKFVIDRVIANRDERLLLYSFLIFSGTVILLLLLSIVRGRLSSSISVNVSSTWTLKLFKHAVALPVIFFQRRTVSDLISRFSSVNSLQYTMTVNLVELVIGTVVAGTIAVLLCKSSVALFAIVIAIIAASVALRAAFLPLTMRLSEEAVILDAEKNDIMIESFRGIQAIRVAKKESARVDKLARNISRFAHCEIRLQNLMVMYSSATQFVSNAQRVLLASVGALLILRAEITIGTLIAFLVYAEMFAWRVSSLIDRLAEMRVVRLHVDRISDVATQGIDEEHVETSVEKAYGLKVDSLTFKYDKDGPTILKDVSFSVAQGRSLAIYGPSGAGKTTLVKLILGLLKPTSGSISVSGHSIESIGASQRKAFVASVMQDDTLFAGSVTDNIALEDPHPDLPHIERLCRLVGIHKDIERMPLRYDTFIGEAGNSLSGGQKQRVLLARALYMRPCVLVLDEATSNLDPLSEREVNLAVRSLGVTTIIVAHRRETIESADHSVCFDELTSAALEVN